MSACSELFRWFEFSIWYDISSESSWWFENVLFCFSLFFFLHHGPSKVVVIYKLCDNEILMYPTDTTKYFTYTYKIIKNKNLKLLNG